MLQTHAPTYTEDQLEYLKWYNHKVQYFLYAATCGFLLSLASLNGLYRLVYSRSTRKTTSSKSITGGPPARRRLFALAVLAGYRKWSYRRSYFLEVVGYGSAAQATVILGFWIITFSLTVSGGYGYWDYMAHHAARICFALVPLLVGLASREIGVIAWITGLHSSTLTALHRSVGRSAIVLAAVHVSGRVYTNLPRIDLRIGYQASGLLGFILWILMALLSVRWIRTRFYKFFIWTHLAAFALSLIALSIHRPQVAPFLIAGAVIYSSDRLVRLCSVLYYALRSSRRGGAAATVEVLSDDVIRVRVETKKGWLPGAHAYLHAPLIDAGGHPFSIASTFLPISHLRGEPIPNEATQTFLVRVHKGFTLKLKERAIQEAERLASDPTKDEETSIRLSPILTEGPYGHNLRLHRYESVVLIVGGTGVTFAVGFLLDLVRRARSDQLQSTRKIVTKRVTFVWSVRDRSEVEWIGTELRDALHYAPPGFLDLQIYVTRMSAPPSSNTKTIPSTATVGPDDVPKESRQYKPKFARMTINPVPSSVSALSRQSLESQRSSISSATEQTSFTYLPTSPTDSMLPPLSFPTVSASSSTLVEPPKSRSAIEIPLISGRCRPREIIDRVVGGTSYAGSVAVGTCGPSKLTEEVGRACSDINEPTQVYRGESRLNIMLHVESYGW
ncbi:hypothetical protein JCM16303_000911 [Sporobolomyces ruberrimus]